MPSRWYYSPDGRSRLGPFSLEEMRQPARDGRLNPTHMVRQEDVLKWTPAADCSELFRRVAPVRQQGSPQRDGQRLGLSLSGVNTRLHRARLQMRQALAPHFGEPAA